VKHTVGGVGKAIEVDGVLQGRRRRCTPGEAVEVEDEAIKWRRGRRGRGDGVLRALAVSRRAP
jgi:hypothetical protein